MNADEILERVIEKLKMHTVALGKSTDSVPFIGQEPYKSDIFKLFITAYKNKYFDINSSPRLTGDAIRDIVIERWMPENDPNLENKDKTLEKFCAMWDEWKYALDKAE